MILPTLGLHLSRVMLFTDIRLRLKCLKHRDKARVQMLAKMFPHLKVLCQLFMGPTLGLDMK